MPFPAIEHLKSRGRVAIQEEMVLNGMALLSVLGGSQGALLARADLGQREERWLADWAGTQADFCLCG